MIEDIEMEMELRGRDCLVTAQAEWHWEKCECSSECGNEWVTEKWEEVEIDDLEVMHLPTDFSSELFKRQDVQNFINFAEEFAYNANYIDANKSYYSDDERYEIKYTC